MVKFCDANRIDERRLVMFQGLTYIINLVEEMQHEQTSGLFSSSSVIFHFKPPFIAKLQSYLITEFMQEVSVATDGGNILDSEDDDWDND